MMATDVDGKGQAGRAGDELPPVRETPGGTAFGVDRLAAALLALSALYIVFFGTAISEWLWYALAAVIGSGYFLWRSLKR